MLHHLLCCTCSALDGPASREVSPVGDHIASCGRSGWIPKVGTDSPLRAYTFYYERDLKAHKDFLEEKRPDKNTRPANYTAERSPVEPQHGFLIVQHLHDRRAPWPLSPILLSYSVLTLHDDLAAQKAHAEKFDKEFQPRSHWGRYRHNYDGADVLMSKQVSICFQDGSRSKQCLGLGWGQCSWFACQ